MKKKYIIKLATLGLALSVLAGCGFVKSAEKGYNPKIDPQDFSTKVNNKYFTLTPGRTFIYKGTTKNGKEVNVATVLDKTKKVMGVETVVVRDRVWANNELIENTKDWYAQDKDGNVWYFGEDSKEYKNGKVVSTKGSWKTGIDGAKPGIIMKADPKVGDKYRQEYYKGKAEDMGEVMALGKKVTVPTGTYKKCLMTRDYTPLEPKVNEHKYYSPAIGGVVLEKSVNGSERLELVEVRG